MRKSTTLTLDAEEAGAEKSREVFGTRMADVEQFVGDVELAVTTSGTALVGLPQDVPLTADVAVVALDTVPGRHATVDGRLHDHELVTTGTRRLERVPLTVVARCTHTRTQP